MNKKNTPTCCDCGLNVARKKVKRCKQCEINRRTLSDEERAARKEEIKKYKAKLYQQNREKISKRAQERREKMKIEDPDTLKQRELTYFLRWKYGMEITDYENLIKKQNGLCAICGYKPDSDAKKENKLYVDHNHKTNRVRGLLCMNCNSAIGHLNEDLTSLKKAIEYIETNNQIDEKTGINSKNIGNPSHRGSG